MGLLGKSFRDFVGDQVNRRQTVLGEYSSRFGEGNSTKSLLTSTPWIRLASAVDLKKDKEDGDTTPNVYDQMEKGGLFDGILDKLTGDNLAKEFVLFGGVNNTIGGVGNTYSGLNSQDSTQIFGGAYGFGNWNQLFSENGEGYKPMPGVTNVEFSYRNDGALSQASVTVKAFSRMQFHIIDVLFQRPGYTVLLEFGHSTFIDNQGIKQYAGEGDYSYSTKPFSTLFNTGGNATSKVSHYTLAKEILSEKKKWNGNYEGAFMKITKYKWKYNTDGSYDITINLVGIGDIISSLKTNIIPISKLTDESAEENTDNEVDDLKALKEAGNFIIGDALSTSLNFELFKIYQTINKDVSGYDALFGTTLETVTYIVQKISEYTFAADGLIKDFNLPIYNSEGLIEGFEKQKLSIPKGIFMVKNVDTDGAVDDYNDSCYITFGYLVSLISKYVNLEDEGTPQISFNLNYTQVEGEKYGGILEKDENFLATYPGNISSNVKSILIPFKSLPEDILEKMDPELREVYEEIIEDDSEVREQLVKYNSEFFVEGEPTKGRLDRVLLDINYIAKTLSENTKDLECKLIDFLDQILNDINNSLGGMNSFRIIFDQDKQLISFISEVPANSEEEEEGLTLINTVGVTQGNGSFVKDLDLNSELSDDFATIISVGAQKDGNNLQGNAGAFSLYNKGLEDRIIKEKKSSPDKGEGEEETDADGNRLKNPIEAAINEDFLDALEEVYDDYNFLPDYISLLSTYNSSITPLITGELFKAKKYPAPFFLPFNLGLTLHGLGGLRIYDGFKVDGKVLPPSYSPSSISLIIKSLTHSVSLEGWTTKIETIAKPIFGEIQKLDTPGKLAGAAATAAATGVGMSLLPASLQQPPAGSSPESVDRFNAMKKSFTSVFSQQGEKSGMCSRWSYNLALNYCRALKENPSIPGRQVAAGGNANQNKQYFKNLVKLGYTQYKVGTNISKKECQKLINNPSSPWGYGDVIVYYANDGDPSASHRKYGHTQIYVGSLVRSKWSTSTKSNYGSSFVYGSRNSDKWDFLVFRAPENSSQVKI